MTRLHTKLQALGFTPDFHPGLFFLRCRHPIRQLLSLMLAVLSVPLYFSCTTSGSTTAAMQLASVPDTVEWQQVRPGIFRFDYTSKEIPLRLHAVKIDLSSPGITLCSCPDGDLQGKGYRPAEFYKTSGADVIINTLPFQNSSNYPKKIPLGMYTAAGRTYSKPHPLFCALCFSQAPDGTWRASIQKDQRTATGDYVFGGYYIILNKGIVQPFKANRAARTAAGTADGGRTLLILTAEARPARTSRGLTNMECAQILHNLGAEKAMQFDGGRSAALYIGGKNILAAAPRSTPVLMGIRSTAAPAQSADKSAENIDE